MPVQMDEAGLRAHAAVGDLRLDLSPLWLDEDGRAAALAALGLRGERGWIGGFGVAGERRGQGLGARLGEATIEAARDAGARRLQLEVLAGNDTARRLYERLGFVGTRELLLLQRPADAPLPDASADEVQETTVEEAIGAPSPLAQAWQREPAALAAAGFILA